MRQRTDIEMERAKVAKITRSLIRLKKSLEADEMINEVLPENLAQFDIALQNGQLRQLNDGLLLKAIFGDADG